MNIVNNFWVITNIVNNFAWLRNKTKKSACVCVRRSKDVACMCKWPRVLRKVDEAQDLGLSRLPSVLLGLFAKWTIFDAGIWLTCWPTFYTQGVCNHICSSFHFNRSKKIVNRQANERDWVVFVRLSATWIIVNNCKENRTKFPQFIDTLTYC